MREYEYELDEELNSVLNKYIRDEEDYKDLCVQILDKNIEENPEAQQLINIFKSLGANDLEAKLKLAELMLAGM